MNPTRQRLARAKFALPSFVTLLSIACGFGSIVISVDNAHVGNPGDYRLAAILLVLAGVFDALDGFVARATNTQSSFGVQLDSIADVMNFGCAPGLLLYCYGFAQMSVDHPTLVRMGGLACFVFVTCGALRLARFNISHGRTDPVEEIGLGFRTDSLWFDAAVGYSLTRWLRAETFYSGTHQTSTARGNVDRARIGIQFVTFKPVRIE